MLRIGRAPPFNASCHSLLYPVYPFNLIQGIFPRRGDFLPTREGDENDLSFDLRRWMQPEQMEIDEQALVPQDLETAMKFEKPDTVT